MPYPTNMAPAGKRGEPSENEKKLLEQAQKGDVDAVRCLLGEGKMEVNCVDEHGMSALQHAAYKGNLSLCRLLLDHGARVNDNQHDNRYTALMFAALSGNVKLTHLLLDAGASTGSLNSVGRTAAQMAAFVGNHACVSAINNYVAKETIEYYTEPRGLETEPKLPPHLAASLRRLALAVNVHPLAVVKMLLECQGLVGEGRCPNVLDLMRDRQFKSKDGNELLAFKFHYLSYMLRYLNGSLEGPSVEASLDAAAKRMAKGRASDGFPETMEKLVRQSIREFPYPASSVVQQLAHSLARCKIGEEPTAVSLVSSAVGGPRMSSASEEDDRCEACGESDAQKRCSACKAARYCDRSCQKWHWSSHRKHCAKQTL